MAESHQPGWKKRAVIERLESCRLRMQNEESRLLGYPLNLSDDFNMSALLQPFQQLHLNNVGDPTEDSSTFHMHTHDFERDVLEWFARLWHMNASEPWGYVTSGGTEGNIFGAYLGRELLPDAILYASDQAHYSVSKAARLCRIPMERIKSMPSGEMDYSDLDLRLNANRGRPALLVLNIGTTMRGAVDDIDRVVKALGCCQYGPDDYYIHCDAALSGMLLPFAKPGLIGFHKPIGSMSVSGHKFLGTTAPCGIVMTRRRFVDTISKSVEYIGMHDNTLAGSRNGMATIALWYVIASLGTEGLQSQVEQCYRNAALLRDLLVQGGWPDVGLGELSTTVTFKSPDSPTLIKKWSLACENGTSHVVVMPHCDSKKLRSFAMEMLQSQNELDAAIAQHGAHRLSPPDLQPEHCMIGEHSRCNLLLVDDRQDDASILRKPPCRPGSQTHNVPLMMKETGHLALLDGKSLR